MRRAVAGSGYSDKDPAAPYQARVMPAGNRFIKMSLLLCIVVLLASAYPPSLHAQQVRHDQAQPEQADPEGWASQKEPESRLAAEEGQAPFAIRDDLGEAMRREASQVREQFNTQARSLFQKESLGFNLDTFIILWKYIITVPERIPELMLHVREQSRLLGAIGSIAVFAFLVALIAGLVGRKRLIVFLGHAAEPLVEIIPAGFAPALQSILKILSVSVIPLLFLGIFYFLKALTAYEAPWFLLTGGILKLWFFGAFIIALLRELLLGNLLRIREQYGLIIFRIARFITVYVLLVMFLFLIVKVLGIRRDILALIRFFISLSVVLVLLIPIAKKKEITGLVPELPYRFSRMLRSGFIQLYYPIMAFTFLTGILWCLGYYRLCRFIWIKAWGVAAFLLVIASIYHGLQRGLKRWHERKDPNNDAARTFYRVMHSALFFVVAIVAVVITMRMLGLYNIMIGILSLPLFRIGTAPMSLWIIIQATLTILVFIILSRLLRAYLDYRVYPKMGLEEGLAYSINTFLGYLITGIGFLASLIIIGIDLRVLMVFAESNRNRHRSGNANSGGESVQRPDPDFQPKNPEGRLDTCAGQPGTGTGGRNPFHKNPGQGQRGVFRAERESDVRDNRQLHAVRSRDPDPHRNRGFL